MEDGDDMDVSHDGTATKRACDPCRLRKTRCNRGLPCSSCKASKLTCITTAPAPKVQRQRIHISEAYEKKIDRLDDRLANIESMFADLTMKLSSIGGSRDSVDRSSRSWSSHNSAKSPSAGSNLETTTPAPYEGETTINSQSDYARKLLVQTIGRTPTIGSDPEINSALAALGELVSQQGQASSASQPLVNRTLAETNPTKLEKPPWGEVKFVLDMAYNNPGMSFAVMFPFLKMKNLPEIFEDAYYNTALCSAARRVLAFGIMEDLFTEFNVFPTSNMDTNNYRTYSTLCRRHLEVSMAQLDMFMPASYENIMALFRGCLHAIERCKPSLCWILNSTAASLCQNLGYHRINTMASDSAEERNSKIHVFWMVYMFDRTLSLRLGRAGVIQDWDISLPFVLRGEQPTSASDGSEMLVYWVKSARVQGQVYEKLFCPDAFLKSSVERIRIANELVDAMSAAWHERGKAIIADFAAEHVVPVNYEPTAPGLTNSPSSKTQIVGPGILATCESVPGSFKTIQNIFYTCDEVAYHSTCALVQRAVVNDDVGFDQKSLESSRAALAAHMRANAQFNNETNKEIWSGYIHWSILHAPFTPFTVMFCNAIQNTDSSDIQSLTGFVSSLESSRNASEGADKLYKMCRLFLQVAKLYLRSRPQSTASQPDNLAPHSSQPNFYTTTDGTEILLDDISSFDPYLSALGLMPNSAWPMAGCYNAPISTATTGFVQAGATSNAPPPEMIGMGFMPSMDNQNSVQGWFAGSRYLMNLIEADNDMIMPDLDL